jgi:hypothetical protein
VTFEATVGWLVGKALFWSRVVQVEAHVAELAGRDGLQCFVRVTNRSLFRKAVLVEVFLQGTVPIPVLNDERPMPVVLPPEEPWETWIPLAACPNAIRSDPVAHVRVKLSDGSVISAKPTANVSPAGFVAGGKSKRDS